MLQDVSDDDLTWSHLRNLPDRLEVWIEERHPILRFGLLAPLWILNKCFRLRFFTSWYQLAIILFVTLDATHTLHSDYILGPLWTLACFVPLASSFVIGFAHGLRRVVVLECGWILVLEKHLITHFLPSAAVFYFTSLPHPKPLVSMLILVFFLDLYLVTLGIVWQGNRLRCCRSSFNPHVSVGL